MLNTNSRYADGSAPFTELSYTHIGTLAEKLTARSIFLGTAESCTGGLVAALCTQMPGSSAWFKGGVIAYANEVKERVLGVPARVLEREGAVSEAVVRAMVTGAIRTLGVQAAVAISGIAGPDGGSVEKPVGTVWIAAGIVADSAGTVSLEGLEQIRTVAERYLFPGDRTAVRRAAALKALKLVERVVAAR